MAFEKVHHKVHESENLFNESETSKLTASDDNVLHNQTVTTMNLGSAEVKIQISDDEPGIELCSYEIEGNNQKNENSINGSGETESSGEVKEDE
jgi:hypothetical protein